MAKKKSAGAGQHRRPAGHRLGAKVAEGEKVSAGMVLIRQIGTRIGLGKGVAVGRDHTVYAVSKGIVKFGKRMGRKIVSVLEK